MARATSGLGQFRGKVGSVVFRVNQGQQIASAYQPAVKNPKSNLQTAQRNKMYLASQLSKLVPREDIIGLAPNASVRDRRSMFIKHIIDNTTSNYDGEVFKSSVGYSNIVLSNGDYITGLLYQWDDETGTLEITINKRLVDEEMYGRLALKVCSFIIVNGVANTYKSAWIQLPSYTETQGDVITIDVVIGQGNMAVYVIPVLLKDNIRYSSEKKTLVQLTSDNTGEFVIVGQYGISSAVLEWKHSIAAHVSEGGVVVPPSTGGDEVVNPDGPSFPNLG